MALPSASLSGTADQVDIALEVSRRLEEARRSSIESIDSEALKWLAILPEWTESLARDCKIAPAGSDVGSLIEQVRAADLCQVYVQRDLVGEKTVRFWMDSEVRALLFSEWRERADLHLDLEVKEIAGRILAAHKASRPVSTGILRWAQLAEDELADDVVTGRSLEERMARSLGAGNISEAGEWLFAAEWLSEPLGAMMDYAAEHARQQLSIHHLKQQDEKYVKWFLPRKHQVDELKFLAGSDDQWGVHFIGPSGVGKTMLMRFVNSKHELNPFRSSSRVDFDYLDPAVPIERPARLLQELGEGFAVEMTTAAQSSLFKSFIESVRVAEAAREAMGSEAIGLAAKTEQFDQAVKAFGLFLESLPQPVALVLDTCEELAKLEPPDGRMWAVDATFDILEKVRSAMPELKLIVGGRRWVTSKYANIPRRELPAPESVMNAPDRPFLRFQPTRGFTAAEARRYLLKRHEDLPEGLIESILENTKDEGQVPAATEGFDEAGEVDLYSPNDLALCARVLEEDRELGATAIREGKFDSYLKDRIFARLADAPRLRRLFPVAAVLGHFDAATIEPFLGATAPEREAQLKRLSEEEWTHLEGGRDLKQAVFKVDPGLLPRLQAYYAGNFGLEGEREEKRRKLEVHLAAKLEKGPPEATLEVVDAAVKLLPPDVALEKLAAGAERAAAAGAWSWSEAVARRLLDVKRKPEVDGSLLATIWALYLTAMNHGQTHVDLAPLWTGVAELAEMESESARERSLAMRARLAAFAASTEGVVVVGEADGLLREGIRLVGRSASDSLASALLAAVERLIDSGEENGAEIPEEATRKAIQRLSKHFKRMPGMRLHLAALDGRLAVLSGDLARADDVFTEVERLAREVTESSPSLADWEGPSSLAARATLELLRFRLATGSMDPRLLTRCAEIAFDAAPGADSAQLLSLVLQARLAQGPAPKMDMNRVAEFEARIESYQPRVPAHRTAPPLFVSVALSWISCDELRTGMALLDERERKAMATGTEERSTRAAALARLRILRRFRLDKGVALVSHMVGGDEEERTEALAAGALIAGIQPTLGPKEKGDHAAWRARNLLRPGEAEALLPAIGPADAVGGRFGEAHLLLDLLELEYVRQRWTGQQGSVNLDELRGRLAQLDLGNRPSLCDPLRRDLTRIAVRRLALLGDPVPPDIAERTGQLAQIALEEGELLGLRLPEQAAKLLAVAVECFTRVGDSRGAFIACLRRAIAEVHAGRSTEARNRQEEVLDRYQELCRQQTTLPALGALTSREPKEVIDPDALMRGWLWRLLYYHRWCEGEGSSRRATETAKEFGPEFVFKPSVGFAGLERVVRNEVRRRRRRRAAGFGIVGVAGLVGLAVAAVAGLHLLGLSLLLSVLVIGGSIAAMGASVFLIETLGPRLSRRVIPLDHFDLTLISPPRLGKGRGLNVSGLVLVRPRSTFLPVRLYLRASRRWYPRRFRRISPRGPRGGKGSLSIDVRRALRPTLSGGYVPLRLEVSPELAYVPWERVILAELSAAERWTPSRSPQIVRVRPRGFPRSRTEWSEGVAAICAPRWRQFVEGSGGRRVLWSPDLSSGRPTSPAAPGSDGEMNARAVIALGTPAETKAGWRLRLDEVDLSQPPADPSEARDQNLLAPEHIARRFPLVVLVGPPSGDHLVADAQSSDGLRGLANEIFLAGAHAVITVPALPSSVAARALERLVDDCEGWDDPPDEHELEECVRRMRSRIFEGLGYLGPGGDKVPHGMKAQLSLDVCLFGPAGR